MPANESPDDRKDLKQRGAAWEEFDNTGDESLVVDFLADDVFFCLRESLQLLASLLS